MILEKLEMTNFKSFYGKHSVDFTKYEPGLHFILGSNKHIPKLEGNGVGKSTLFEAVFWVLYGKTLRGASATNITSWGEQQTSVTVYFNKGLDNLYTICRTRGKGKNSLTIASEHLSGGKKTAETEQDAIDKIIGMPSALFGPAFVRGQFSNMFFERPPAEQLAVMTDILSLQSWSDLSKVCVSKVKELERDIAATGGKITVKVENKEEQKHNARWGKEKMEAWAQENKNELKEAKTKKSALNSKLDKLTDSVKELEAKKDKWKTKQTASHLEFDKAKNAVSAIDNQIGDCRQSKESQKRTLAKISKSIQEAADLLGQDCPVCNQAVTSDSMSHLENHYKHEQDESNTILKELQKKIVKLEAKEEKAQKVVRGVSDKMRDIDSKVGEFDSRLEKKAGKRYAVNSKCESQAAEISRLSSAVNPYKEVVEKNKKADKQNDADIKELQTKLAAAETDEQSSEFWASGFREVRLFVIEKALGALQVEVNNVLSAFGLSDFSVVFACEKQNKSGTVSNKFDVLVTSPHSKQAVPWSAWSGGEYQRLRLACELGISNLILDSRGVSPSFEVWDEPTTHMSKQGVQDLMRLLQQRAYESKRSVFVIDHIARDFPFDSVTEIVKEGNKSVILPCS